MFKYIISPEAQEQFNNLLNKQAKKTIKRRLIQLEKNPFRFAKKTKKPITRLKGYETDCTL